MFCETPQSAGGIATSLTNFSEVALRVQCFATSMPDEYKPYPVAF
jgi:hypothetical protein